MMNPYVVPIVFVLAVWLAIVMLNERYQLLSVDQFPSPVVKVIAYLWLGAFFFIVTVLIVTSSMHVPTPKELAHVPFYSLFLLHAILVVFLIGWWLMTRRPRIDIFLNIRTDHVGEAVMTGFAVGVGGWIVTILIAIAIAAVLAASGLIPKNPQPPPMIGWMASLPLWKKGAIVLSAMVIEEAFFRGWLQKRIGLIASTVLFALAHSGLGQPLLLIGVSIISLIIGVTFYRTKNLIPGMIAHGIFDGVQLFVIIPILFKVSGLG